MSHGKRWEGKSKAKSPPPPSDISSSDLSDSSSDDESSDEEIDNIIKNLDPKTKRILGSKHLKGRNLKPMFVQLVLDNIWAVYEATVGGSSGKG